MARYVTEQDRIDDITMRIDNPNMIGSGFIQHPPMQRNTKPVAMQPPTVSHLLYPEVYTQQSAVMSKDHAQRLQQLDEANFYEGGVMPPRPAGAPQPAKAPVAGAAKPATHQQQQQVPQQQAPAPAPQYARQQPAQQQQYQPPQQQHHQQQQPHHQQHPQNPQHPQHPQQYGGYTGHASQQRPNPPAIPVHQAAYRPQPSRPSNGHVEGYAPQSNGYAPRGSAQENGGYTKPAPTAGMPATHPAAARAQQPNRGALPGDHTVGSQQSTYSRPTGGFGRGSTAQAAQYSSQVYAGQPRGAANPPHVGVPGAARPQAAQRPAMGAQRPAMGVQRPAVGVQRPAVGVQRPAVGVQRPAVGVQRGQYQGAAQHGAGVGLPHGQAAQRQAPQRGRQGGYDSQQAQGARPGAEARAAAAVAAATAAVRPIGAPPTRTQAPAPKQQEWQQAGRGRAAVVEPVKPAAPSPRVQADVNDNDDDGDDSKMSKSQAKRLRKKKREGKA